MGVDCDDGGYSDGFTHRYERRARKEHRCCACRETIRVGHVYEVLTSCWEGSLETYKRCLRCVAMWRLLVDAHRDARTEWGVDWELDCGHAWSEFFEGEPPLALQELAFKTAEEMQQRQAPDESD